VKSVHWLLELSIHPEHINDFDAIMLELVRETDREVGTMACEWNFNDDGSICTIYERFMDADAAMVHLGMFGDRFADRFLKASTVTRLTLLGHVSDELKNALKGFNPMVLTQRAGFARFAD